MQNYPLSMGKLLLILSVAFLFSALPLSAKILDPSAPTDRGPQTSEPILRSVGESLVPTPQAAVEPPEEFSVPVDEMHATGSFNGNRLLTGTRDGEFAAFTIKKGDAGGYQVVELSHGELAWQLSKIVLGWGLVATLLFTALFAVAGKSRRHIRRRK